MFNTIKKYSQILLEKHPILIIIVAGMILIGFRLNSAFDHHNIIGTKRLAFFSLYGIAFILATVLAIHSFGIKEDKN